MSTAATTWAAAEAAAPRDRIAGLAVAIAAGYASYAWLALPVLDRADEPTGGPLAIALWGVGLPLKGTALASTFLLLGRVASRLTSRRLALRAAGWWAAALFAVAIAMALLRDPIAAYLYTPSEHITSHEFVGYDNAFVSDRPEHDAWIAAWDGGRIFAIEGAFFLALAASMAAICRVLRHRRHVAAAACALTGLGLAASLELAAGLTVLTYDVFYGGILAGPLLREMTWPLPLLPASPVVATFLLGFALASRQFLRSVDRSPSDSAATPLSG